MRSAIRERVGPSIRARSLAALPLIRIEKLTLHLIPIQHGIIGVLEPFDGDRKIVKVLEVSFNRLPDDLRPAPVQLRRSGVQRFDNGIGEAGGDLAHGMFLDAVNVDDITLMSTTVQGEGLPLGSHPSAITRDRASAADASVATRWSRFDNAFERRFGADLISPATIEQIFRVQGDMFDMGLPWAMGYGADARGPSLTRRFSEGLG